MAQTRWCAPSLLRDLGHPRPREGGAVVLRSGATSPRPGGAPAQDCSKVARACRLAQRISTTSVDVDLLRNGALQMKIIRLFPIVLTGFVLSACAGASRPPLHEEYTGTNVFTRGAVLSSISTDASYRSAYILLNSGADRGAGLQRHPGQFCPEPPPDVAQAVSAAITAALKGAITPPEGATAADISAEFGNALATSVAPLVRRNQGLQFFRDKMFYTCVAYLNGALPEDEYRRQLSWSAELASSLIALELISSPPEKSDAKTVETDLKKSNDMLQSLRSEIAQINQRLSK